SAATSSITRPSSARRKERSASAGGRGGARRSAPAAAPRAGRPRSPAVAPLPSAPKEERGEDIFGSSLPGNNRLSAAPEVASLPRPHITRPGERISPGTGALRQPYSKVIPSSQTMKGSPPQESSATPSPATLFRLTSPFCLRSQRPSPARGTSTRIH